ncbi:MAG: galactokinase [Bacteroidia bacterium]
MYQLYFAPGRVNLIGEHLDYNGGWVLPAAISKGITAKVEFLPEKQLILSSAHASLLFRSNINENFEYKKTEDWVNYPKGIIREINRRFPLHQGLAIHFESNLPMSSGLSSSAAIEVLTAFILYEVHGQKISRKELALLCQKVENEFIGVNCGIMDQYAVANGKEGNALLLDCATVSHQDIPFQTFDYQLLVMNTCKPRKLIEGKYNERRSECEAALALIQKKYEIPHLAAANQAMLTEMVQDALLYKRARHVISEQARVLETGTGLASLADLQQFGQNMNASHLSLKNDYEVSGIELDTLVETAQQTAGCLGARMTGAGFGGCAIALVKKTEVEAFIALVSTAYEQKIGYAAEIYPVEIAAGVHKVS